MMKAPVPMLCQTLFRADYSAKLDHFSEITKVAAQIQGYAEWEVGGAEVTFKDFEKRRSVVLDPGAFIYSQHSGDEECELQSIDDLLRVCPKGLNLSTYNRLGLRKKYLLPRADTFEQVIALFHSKGLRFEELTVFMPKMQDSFLRFDCIEEPYNFHISVAVVRQNELFRVLEFNRNHFDPRSALENVQKLVKSYP